MKAGTAICMIMAFVALLDASLADGNCADVTVADIIVLGDASNSIAIIGYTREKNFTCNLAKGVTYGPKHAQFGFAAFSTEFVFHFNLNTFSTADSFCQGVLAIKQLHQNTDTAGALDKIREGDYFFDPSKGARPGVAKVLVLITDGQSDNTTATQIAAAKLRALNIVIIPVGVGSVNIAELDGISGKTGSALSVKSFSAIDSIADQILTRICNATPATPVTPCPPSARSSINFLLDSSSSIGPENFVKGVASVKSIANRVDVDIYASNTYGTHPRVVCPNTDDKALFISKQDEAQYQSSTTQTDLAIAQAVSQGYQLPSDIIIKIILLITDGLSTEPDKTQAAAKIARASGFTLLAVGVGPDADQNELVGITGNPNYVFHADDYNDLASRVGELTHALCGVTQPPPTTAPPPLPTCPPAKALDIVYTLDASGSVGAPNFVKAKALLTQLTTALTIGPDDTNVGSVVYGTHAYKVDDLSSDKNRILQKIDGIQYRNSSTGTNLAIDLSVDILDEGREDAVSIIIVITDGKSDDPIATTISAYKAQLKDIILFAVGVGEEVDDDELSSIASDDSKVFKAPSYNELYKVAEALSKGTCDQIREP